MNRRVTTTNSAVLAEHAKIVQMWLTGMSVRSIARENGISLSTVYRRIRRWTDGGHMETRHYCRRHHVTSLGEGAAAVMAGQYQQLAAAICAFQTLQFHCISRMLENISSTNKIHDLITSQSQELAQHYKRDEKTCTE